MKLLKICSLLLFGFFASSISAQKIGVVDTDYILSQMPQYRDAEARLNTQVAAWQKEVSDMQTDLENKKAALENERVLLIGDQLKNREKEISELDKKIKLLINGRFGAKGEINSTRSDLAKPFQDRIWNAIKTVSEKNSLGIILDKSSNINVIFLEKRYDYTDKVLALLLKNQDAPSSGNATAPRGKGRDQRGELGETQQVSGQKKKK